MGLSCNNFNDLNKISTDIIKQNESIDFSCKEKEKEKFKYKDKENDNDNVNNNNNNKILSIIDIKGK